MPADPESQLPSEPHQLEAAADEAIAACGGNTRDAVKALIVANEFFGIGSLRIDAGYFARPCARKVQDLHRVTTMAEVTYYVALPFVASDDGNTAGEPTECFNAMAVVMRAEALSRKEGHIGAVAFSRTGDPATGDFSDATVLKKFGDVSDDLSTL